MELYNVTVEGYRIYYTESSNYIKAANVKFVGKNVFGYGNDPIFVLNTGNGDTVFSNCEFSNFKAKSLIQAKAQINFYGTNNIKNNEFINYAMNYESGHTMHVANGATVNIESNTIKSDIANTSIINFNNPGRLFIDTNGILNITNNTFATGTTTPTRQAAIYIPKSAYIDVNSKLKVLDNKSNNGVHAYQIYSEKTDWFIQTNGSKINTDYSRFKVYINSSDGTGTVFKKWTTGTAQDVNKYNTCIIPDDIYLGGAEVALENNNVVIKIIQQVHKLCGAASGKACSHLAVSNHTGDVTFKAMPADFKTTGTYFLSSNRTLTKNITLTGALNLCLNGFTLNLDKYQILGNYNLTICDCKGTGKITVGENKAELFKNTKVVLFGNSDSKKMSVEGYRIYYTDSGSSYSFYASNVYFTGKKAAGLNNDGAFYTNSQDTLTFANSSFTNFV